MNTDINPLLQVWETPFGLPPFNLIKEEHFIPALTEAINIAKTEINEITASSDKADFKNTIEALEHSGKQLNRIASTLFNLNSAETNTAIQEATQEASQLLTRFSNDITLDRDLFGKVLHVYKSADRDNLNEEQIILLDERYKTFRNGGAELKGAKRDRFREVSEELSMLTVKFEENVLAETNSYELCINNEDDLTGLPEGIINAASEEAEKRGKDGWVFTLHAPSYIPFMQYSRKRELRQTLLEAYTSRANHDNSNNNRSIVIKIANLRLELASLLGYNTFADYVLEDKMASSPSKVISFLEELHKAAKPFALQDLNSIKKFAREKGTTHSIERWDWAFFSEWMKKELYDIDDEVLRPYFSLDKVEKAIFGLAGKLYGLTFTELNNVPVYHPDTRAYEVCDSSDKHIAILLCDYHPRKGKSGGAWMTAYREQYLENNTDIRPIVSIVMNFSKASKDKPALLTHNELTTLLHEFGHALHGMLSLCIYESNSGTNVKRDFVELPSQIMENFAFEKEWLETWATHYKSNEKLPVQLIDKILESHTYNEGYACNRQLGFGILDMAWHSIKEALEVEVEEFEKKALGNTELLAQVKGANQSCAFGHLFSGGYAAGYYGYKWAEVLDADAFSLFKENGIFNRETAGKFRTNILEKGGSSDPMKLYKQFRGAEPTIDALLIRSGFVKK